MTETLEAYVYPGIRTDSSGKRTYTFEEAMETSTDYFHGDRMAAKNWVNKYSLKDSEGNIYETSPDQMHWRIAEEVARIEREKGYPEPLSAKTIYPLLAGFRYIVPQGSPMSGIGNNYQTVSLSNCFVIGNTADSYGGICLTDQEQVQLMKRRGGVGHDLSHIRPSKAPVKNSALTSTGIAPYMERYSNSTREVAQDGRRGALMLTISVKHPDAEKFIDAKMLEGRVTGANVSVKIDDEFMRAVKEGGTYIQQFPVDSSNPKIKREINARDLWGKIIHNAWKSAEPGVLFWDTITRESVPDSYRDLGFETISTNPCGEIPLCADDSCRLEAINLFSYVSKPFTPEARFEMDLFKEHSHYAQRIMDDIVDLEIEKVNSIIQKIEKDPEDAKIKAVERDLWERIKKKSEQGRRTGIGITGEGDMLAALGLTYGSDEAIRFSEQVHKTLAIETYRSSVLLAKERGAFPIYDSKKEESNPFIQRLAEADPQLYEDMKKYGRRNIALLTIAPTGTTSQMTQTSSGIEPAFLPAYGRRRKVNPNDKAVVVSYTDPQGDAWEEFAVVHHKFKTWLEVNGYDVKRVEHLAIGSLRDSKKAKELEDIVSRSPYHKATANDVDWLAKVKLQGAVQKWVDHSISNTINLPKGTPEELVEKLYQTAWESGCKGVTIYVDGSRDGVLLTGNGKKGGLEGKIGTMDNPLKIPGIASAVKIKQQTPWGSMHVNIVVDPARNYAPVEVFGSLGNAGGTEAADIEAVGRLSSLLLRSGGDAQRVISQLKKIGSGVSMVTRDGGVQSLPMAFARALEKYEFARTNYDIGDIMTGEISFEKIDGEISDALREGKNGHGNGKVERKRSYIEERCSDCGGTDLRREEGCLKCNSCGSTKCG